MKSIKTIKNLSFQEFRFIILSFLNNPNPPEEKKFSSILKKTLALYANEDEEYRPRTRFNKPGGLIYLTPRAHTFILPDLHARRKLIEAFLRWEVEGISILDRLEQGECNVVFLGDGVHGEGEKAQRWIDAYEEFANLYKKHEAMDEEIADSFNLMLVIFMLKIRYNSQITFLKGNHENIYNETGNGNYSFIKYANEGAMVLEYFKKFYSNEILSTYSKIEKSFPLFVVHPQFLASHAEPLISFDKNRLINYHNDGELIEALTWTPNYTAKEDIVHKIIQEFAIDPENSVYFAGHRPIKELFRKVNGDNFYQIHNPSKWIVTIIKEGKAFNPLEDVQEIPLHNNQEDAVAISEEQSNDFNFSIEQTNFDFSELFEVEE